ncbi:FliI/YscN family ATPase [Spirochaeta lutea]|uniref:FliI/YscN family ATPase n=1 Tax=Spirochaeta lutea TaxID=1480694 RepID=UPI000563ABF0|nr:FliI/YscN family ATPase [Spirochaeta lutea]
MPLFTKYNEVVDDIDPIKYVGRVERVRGLLIESSGPTTTVGELCQIILEKKGTSIWAEVVGLHGHTVQLMPFSDLEGVEIGSPVVGTGNPLSAPVTEKLLGRVIDSMGRPMDGLGELGSTENYPCTNIPPSALDRSPIRNQIGTGIRAIDGMLPTGKGQRLGIFAGSGVGKSTLLGMIARNTNADVNVIALIGERGREVQEFIANDLGPEGLARSVLIVSTGDTPPLSRLRGAYMATAVAEYFRDQGQDVMLLFDSVTRFARAQREIGLSIGEAPATRGYPPSVFSTLPRLLERCGTSDKGTITGFYTILVDGDDMDEPIADTVRGILDGHLVLSRKLAEAYHYPAIDVLGSISRLTPKITNQDQQKAAGILRRHLAVYRDHEDLISIGAYSRGSNPQVDNAIAIYPAIMEFLQQGIEEQSGLDETWNRLFEITGISPQSPATGEKE